MIGQMIGMNAFLCYACDVVSSAKELSYWGLWLTMIWIMVSQKCALDLDINKK